MTEEVRSAMKMVVEPSGDGTPAMLVARLRDVHLQMVDAVLSGDGLKAVAGLAAVACGAPVAVAVPKLAQVVAAPSDAAIELATVRRYVAERIRDRPAPVPPGLTAEIPIVSGDDVLGAVLLFGGDEVDPAAPEFLHLAAVAALTEVAVEQARVEVEHNLRGSLLEELRARGQLDPDDLIRRAARLGCSLERGAVVLCAELRSQRPRHVVATVAGEYPGALAQQLDDRVYALLPACDPAESGGIGDATLRAARALATRLQRHGIVGLSSFYAEPADLGRALQEAELVLDVLRRSDVPIADEIGSGTYRLLFRVLASHPEEVTAFYDDTVAPLVRYDDQYRTDLIGTLEAYLEHDCNMNSTAAAIFAHRHTVAYRLDRVRELSGLDPMRSQDRERLGLGLKAYRIIAPRLQR